ncbi:GGDEF domain-containing protein [Ferrimonas balearica]|uniref:GGDEF domain-containing protein n=1 Tax=Ferrimonas balearica TaxID=44012 RepID=UPI001C995D19|nr:diguanylate cyclase [Ferrimonas balearica]MBY5921704.1 diguanylate cyclase [Ferrimonas balearica]MBY5994956.1 diguanylate cyclase [Ferrimonas balearica]
MRHLAWGPARRLARSAPHTPLWAGAVLMISAPLAFAAVAPETTGQGWGIGLPVLALTVLLMWCRNLQLKRQGAMMTQLLDHTPTPLMVLDAMGRIQGWNQAAARLFGWSAEQVMNEPMATLLFAEVDQRPLGRILSRLLKEGTSLSLEQPNHTQEGRLLVCQWQFQVLAGQSGGQPLILATVNDITQQKASELNWARLASTDPLTGLANRRHFQSHCSEALTRSRENGTPLTLLYLDLDDFKRVNDRYGHEAGDAVLAQVAKRLQSCMRTQDLLARIGGDEFVVVLESTDFEQAELLAQRIEEAMSQPMSLPKGDNVRQGMSIGVASYPQDGSDAEALVNSADRQMYQAKQSKVVALVQVN